MTAHDILAVARGEIGTTEAPKGSNRIKYNTAYYGKEVSGDSYPWCCVFVWWVFREAGAPELFYGGGKTASCTTLMRYYQQQGQIVTDARPGDLLFYQFDTDSYADHIGIVESVDGGKIVTIEGNAGDMVKRVTVDKAKIMCIARPTYDVAPQPEPTPTPHAVCSVLLPVLRDGDVSKSVLTMQYLLLAYGFKLPRYGPDGEFGAETKSSLLAYQAAQHLTTDGICGPETWARLLS